MNKNDNLLKVTVLSKLQYSENKKRIGNQFLW